MPELPEVEVVRRGLVPHASGREITAVTVHDPRSARRQEGGPERLIGDLVGARVGPIVRRGKFLWWRLEDPGTGADTGRALMTHLGMSGQLRVREAVGPVLDLPGDGDPEGSAGGRIPAPGASAAAPSEGPAPDPERHRRITLELDSGARIDFVDQRLFGGMWTSPLVESADGRVSAAESPDALLPAAAAHIARDVLDPVVDLAERARVLRTRRAGIKSLLLAQDVISGIGNIYADEALWAARTHHDTPGSALSQVRAHRVLAQCRDVMTRALTVGGTSFDALYVNVDGRSGYFERSLTVYKKHGIACKRCGATIVRERFMNRYSHFCPVCQRKR